MIDYYKYIIKEVSIMRKKVFSLLLAALMLTSLLAACGGSSGSSAASGGGEAVAGEEGKIINIYSWNDEAKLLNN